MGKGRKPYKHNREAMERHAVCMANNPLYEEMKSRKEARLAMEKEIEREKWEVFEKEKTRYRLSGQFLGRRSLVVSGI